jgi:LmbE family N-acetylglucosaminyl deacetylase
MASMILGLDSCDFLRLPDWYVGEDIEGAANAITPLLDRYRPERIYLPHPLEWHPDHAASLPAVRSAVAKGRIPSPELLAYEIWTPLGSFDHVEDISSVMELKLAAINCYRSQLTGFAYDRAITGLNQYRGALAAKCDFAEVFTYIT